MPHPSLWASALPSRRAALDTDRSVDVAIIGGGLTGLWTAAHLHERDPHLSIAVIEAEQCGFGASGRNGGWLSALLPMGLADMTASHGRDQAIAIQRAMHQTIDDVLAWCAERGINCDAAKGGTLSAARSPQQAERAHADIAEYRRYGFGEDDYRWLDAQEAQSVVRMDGVLGAFYTPHCAAVHPGKLTAGVAAEVANFASVYEGTPVRRIDGRRLVCDGGTITASVVVRATEAFTSQLGRPLGNHRRAIAPVYSLMVATEPLPTSFFDEVGWAQRATIADRRRMVIYGQRTADNRIAFGGRGAPYHFGSRMLPKFDLHAATHDKVAATIVELFPQLRDAAITHRWGGAVGIARDWTASVGFEPVSGHAWAGGYVGDGLTTTALAGQTLADLITSTDSERTRLPWVNHHSRQWEIEPFRWIGINGLVRLNAQADRYEQRTGKTERWRSAILDRFTGH
jgi:glycine/D-amino acid oxidase-like deaminating enzyme